MSDRHFEALVPTKHNWTFGGLHKYTNYTCRLRAYNNFGTGNWSEELVISTDEDGMLKLKWRFAFFLNDRLTCRLPEWLRLTYWH